MTALCTVSYCPAKKDPDWHRCFVCQNNTIEHHHVKARGMGGSKKRRDDPLNVVALCRSHHEMVTLHECSDDILEINGVLTYVYFDLHGNTLIERELEAPVLKAADEAEAGHLGKNPPPTGGSTSSAVSSAGALSAKEEDDATVRRGLDTDVPSSIGDATGGGVGEPTKTGSPNKPVAASGDNAPNDSQHHPIHHPNPLTHEQRVAKAQEIKDAEWNRQWDAGDTGNAWIAELGESAEQYLSDFGYQPESLANILRVCAAIPLPLRKYLDLRYSHHVVVAGLNREDIEMWLEKCADEGWSVAEFRRQVKGTKPRVKRWNLEELREALSTFEHEPPQSDEAAMVSAESIVFFLDWLGEQE